MQMTVEEIRDQAMGLPISERAGLAHDLIRSLDEPEALELPPQQEAEIQRRIRMVREGKGVGRPAHEVFAEIRANLP